MTWCPASILEWHSWQKGEEKAGAGNLPANRDTGRPGKSPFVTNDAAVIGGAITDLDVFRQYCAGLNNAAYCKQFAYAVLPKLKSSS